MLVVGLLLVVVSAAGAALLISYNSSGGPEQTIVMFGQDWLSVTPLQAFIAGLAVALVFSVGIWMVVGTERRRRAVRAEYRAARSEYRAARREAKVASKERDQLARQIAKRDRQEKAEAERKAAWSPPEEPATGPIAVPHQGGETTETQGPAEPRRGFGRHFRRSGRPAETEEPASTPPK